MKLKPFKITSAEVGKSDNEAESFALGDDAKVVIGFNRPLNKLERKRVKDEVASFVGDVERVSLSGSKLTVRTRDFDAVGKFIEAVNSYAQAWTDDAAKEIAAARSELEVAGESVKSRVVYRVPGAWEV